MRYRKILLFIIFVILVGILVLLNGSQNKITHSAPGNNQALIAKETAKVLKVVDGDTIKVLISGKEDFVRLIGIDSPEVLDERKPVQCFGKEASAKAKEILDNQTIILEKDPGQGEKDEYGRLLRYVFLEDGTNFNKLMIIRGYAYEYTFKGISYKYQSEFIRAEKEAKANSKGLWSSCRNKN